MVVACADAYLILWHFWEGNGIKELECAPHPQQNEHHGDEDKLTVSFANSCHQTRAKVVTLFTNSSLKYDINFIKQKYTCRCWYCISAA